MRTRALSWHQRAMFCASSAESRYGECRSSEARPYENRKSIFVKAVTGTWRPMSKTIWVGAVAYNPKVVTIWEGMRHYFQEEAHLPVEVVLFQSYEAQVIALLSQ